MNPTAPGKRNPWPLLVIAVLFFIGVIFYLRLHRNSPEEGWVLHEEMRYPQRGWIIDRNGKILADNETQYDLMLNPSRMGSMDTSRLCRLLGLSRSGFKRRLRELKESAPHAVSIFEGQVSPKIMAVLRGELPAYPGFFERVRVIRRYPDSLAANLLGFANTISPRARKGAYGYSKPGEAAGRSGLELFYDSLLRGKAGIKYYLTDSTGKQRMPAIDEAEIQALPGRTLTTAIDRELQRFAQQLMKNKVGSIVALDPATGEVLAYLSSPGYDPNLLSGSGTYDHLKTLRADTLYPLANRPIRGRNSPGSSLKPVIALVALQGGLITPDDAFFCPQYYMAGDRRVSCEHFDGSIMLRKAIAQSCNTYFCHVFERQMSSNPSGTRASYEDWRQQLSLFGIGNKLGIDLPHEISGQLPPATFYDKVNNSRNWTTNDIISLAIGQGEMEVTPLQLANMQCIIANRGYYFTPHIVRAAGGKPLSNPQWSEKHVVAIDAAHFDPVINGMQDAVENGTAAGIQIPGMVFCGKTGTVQNSKGKSHSIFAGFAPRDHPRIAIAVVVENAGYGASYAAPIASYLIEKYLKGKVTKPAGQVRWMMEENLLPSTASASPIVEH